MRQLVKSRNTYMLIGILIIQLVLSLFFAGKKNYLFFDEVFSYVSANNVESVNLQLPENRWLDESWFIDYMGVQKNHSFEYEIPYNNQLQDVHPPLFYFFLHTACSMIPEKFSYLAGIGFNILFFMCSTIALYFLGKELFDCEICGLLTSFLYAISYGGLNTMVFIRMYMLMTLMVLLHVLVYVKYFEHEELSLKGCILLGLTMLGGVLTQYYFLFVAFLLGVWYTIKFLYKKQIKNLLMYLLTIFSSAGICLKIWPVIIVHLFYGGRGMEAQSNLISFDGYFASLKQMFCILNNEMFTKLLPVIIIALAVLLFLSWINGDKISPVLWKKSLCIVYLCVGYYLIVSKVAPYLVERYMMPIYPLVYLLVVSVCYILLTRFIPSKVAAILCIIGFGALSSIHIVHSGIPYTFDKHQNNNERHDIVRQYKDDYALYISDNKGCHFFDAIQMLKEYKGYYYIYNLENLDQVKSDMDILENEDSLIVYVKDKRTTQEANNFISAIFPGCILDDNSLIDIDEKWSVYLLDISGVIDN